jgi:glycerol-3-phosphate dehydrogenase
MLSIYGGKITTYRRLAEQALRSLQPFMPNMGIAWTDTAPLPGGDIPGGDFETFVARLRGECPYLPPPLLRRLARSYGTRCGEILGAAQHMADLGEVFLADLTRAEVDYLIHREWARSSDDILFRRTKLGIQSPPEGRERLAAYLRGQGGLTPPPPITSTSG